ncbi:FkbM family methyltransferase [Mycolicibacterium sp. F2034L]|uniref:FkbM family methyltransferase n=1 Tax=Mycolicibacterium sp. F2034L TaxID=2926422 RepID=UPI001FF36062|nr:FkbM family methyltransferase [Mycolicibacterium sp. F2034L]MCK0173779.1 FkbM family methyltransferase [Mycolicibacterium sp. F2034L]
MQYVANRLPRHGVPTEFSSEYGLIQIDPAHAPERALAYCFHNFVSHYLKSPLGRYITSRGMQGKIFVDIGANLGMYSLLARSVGAMAYMFEPEPSHVKFLARNSTLLGSLFPIALSDRKGELPLYYHPNNPGATSLVEASGFIASDLTVRVDTFSEQRLDSEKLIELIKIDVEGNESRTVRGMEDFFERGNRPDIWCEVRGGAAERSPRSYAEVIEYLAKFGYEYYDGTVEPLRIPSPGFDALESRGVFDLLFVAPK